MISLLTLNTLMDYSLLEAHTAEHNHEIPIGAAAFIENINVFKNKTVCSAQNMWAKYHYSIIDNKKNTIITTHNHVQRHKNPLLHAEIILLQFLCHHMQTPFLDHVWIVSTLEPCALCAAALVRHRVAGVVFGAYNTQDGGVVHQKFPQHIPIIGGIQETQCQHILDNFFSKQRVKLE